MKDKRISFLHVEKQAGLEGMRFAVRITDDSLAQYDGKPGDIAIAIKLHDPRPDTDLLHVIDRFDDGITIRKLRVCTMHGPPCLALWKHEEFEICLTPDKFNVLGIVREIRNGAGKDEKI